MKIAALTTVSGPYVVARYSAFANKFTQTSLFLIELGQVSSIYPWKHPDAIPPYQRIILSQQPAELQSSLTLFKGIAKTLDDIKPDVVILCGYAIPGMREALLWSFWHQKPAVLLSESKEDDASRIWWREALKSILMRRYKAALVGGRPHKRYMIKLGIPAEAIFLGYDVVDNDSFHPDKLQYLPVPIEKRYFLAINRFVSKKNLLFLISSYAEYSKVVGNRAWDLVICGEGELRPQIEQQIAQLGLKDAVHLPGFLQLDELLPYFAHADCFIHASIQEQWGLVVNEAMAAALPVLLSNRCGCFEDLLVEGINGFGFDPENLQELTNLMLKISSGEVDLQAMGKASLEHIQKFSPDYFAQGLMQAVEYALAHS
ncbi:MAG: glycosyltransferase family 4 protein [Fischerella sp.]|jgi:glycosyltransferase involved in cell wall biosynthesis|uniref:glycosyltransferase family 4 protein n=1 Tax=Fischerella sp. TaxID=1191 RepID=UPI0017FDCD87|nr:glycosyltransferase family 4 protein [Fischerella sp.]NWF61047.1 glycosyltransferase family 4 protein [Fischerella sp.]